jgi:acetyl esterase
MQWRSQADLSAKPLLLSSLALSPHPFAMTCCRTSRVAYAPARGVELRIPAGQGAFHRAGWFAPPAEDAPLVLHLHAGAFVGAPAAGRVTAIEQLLVQAGAGVVSLQYPLAPQHPFPEAIRAAYASLLYLGRERRRLSGAHARIVVAGAEAGGNIAAGVALMVRDRSELHLTAQILFSPMLDPLLATGSLWRAKVGCAGCRFAEGWRRYAPRASDSCHPYADPAHAMRLHGLPSALLFTANDDPFCDETRAYAQRLIDHGIDASLVSLPPPTHFPEAYMDEAPAEAPWMAVACDSLRRFFAGSARD